MTLESVVTRLGIPMERPFHDALSDTLYTADVCRRLDLRAGLAAYPTEPEALKAALCPPSGGLPGFPGLPWLCRAIRLADRPGCSTGALPGVRRHAGTG